MDIPLTQTHAKQRILDAFPPDSNPVAHFANYSERFYLETLEAVHKTIPFQDETQNQSLARFLYAGCLRFGRWFAPSPYVVSPDLHEKFAQFLQSLKKVEGGSSGNTVTFEIHHIRNKVYAEFDELSAVKVPFDRLEGFRQEMQRIRVPVQPEKRDELLEHSHELAAILFGLEDRSLRTRIKTRLPYILHRASLSLSFQWKSIPVQMTLTPDFRPSGETFANIAPATTTIGTTRWQASTTTIEIELAALIDGDLYAESLQAIEGQDTPFAGWPKCFALAFTLIHEVSWHLRTRYGGEQQWVPAPRDLAEIETSIHTTMQERIGWRSKGSPANVLEGFTPPDEILKINLGELTSLDWSTKCRSLASMYMELGETNEALFWLNVATEALFKERFAGIAVEVDRPNLTTELESPKAFWAPAEEIVEQQFPEMAGKIQWPQTEIHVSIYAKLKFLYKSVEMRTSVKELLRHYRAISKYRNSLFHGVLEHRISLEIVQTAFTDYDWIVTNMWPTEQNKVKP